MTTTELRQEQDKCKEQIDMMLDADDDDDDDTYIPPVIENCSNGYDCESCLSNSCCTWFRDIGYCEEVSDIFRSISILP